MPNGRRNNKLSPFFVAARTKRVDFIALYDSRGYFGGKGALAGMLTAIKNEMGVYATPLARAQGDLQGFVGTSRFVACIPIFDQFKQTNVLACDADGVNLRSQTPAFSAIM